jgi:hypothetical protein
MSSSVASVPFSTFMAPIQRAQCVQVGVNNPRVLGMPLMSGLMYDRGTYQTDLRQSVDVGAYSLAPVGRNCGTCVTGDPWKTASANGTGVSSCDSVVDAESELRNLSRPASRAPCSMYRGDGSSPSVCPSGAPGTSGKSRIAVSCDSLPTVDTRLVNPPCTLRGTGWNRFEWLCRDPQTRATVPFSTNVDTSLVIKDNHRPYIARPLDPTMVMPPVGRSGPPDHSFGAPQWMPTTEGPCAIPAGNASEPPCMMFTSCSDPSSSFRHFK